MSQNPQRLRRAGAGVAIGALAASTLLITSPAQAASTVSVTAGDIAPTEAVYAGWHQGAVNGGVPGQHRVTSEGLTLIGRSQVIKGYANTTRTLDVKNLDLDDLDDASLVVTRGSVDLQVPIFFDSATKDAAFTTLRPATPATSGTTDVDLDDDWISTGDIDATHLKNTPYPLEDIIGALDDYKTLAFGVYNQAGLASVSSITVADTTYSFDAAAPAAATVRNADIAPNENTYAGWHQGYAKTPAGAQVTARGLELAGRSQIIRGYDNSSNVLTTQNANLAASLLDASYTVVSGGASLQVPIFFDNNGSTRFATLRSAGSTGGHVDLDDLWLSSGNIDATHVKDVEYPLGELLAAIGDKHKVIAFGVQSETNTIVKDITWDGTTYTFADAPAVNATSDVLETGIAPDETTYAGWHQGAVNAGTPGSQQVRTDGLNLIGRSQVIKGYANNSSTFDTKNISLLNAIAGGSYTVASGSAAFQIALFVADESTGDPVFTTLRIDHGTGSHTFSVQDQWTSSKAVNGIAKDVPTQLSTIIKAFKDYKVLAFGVYGQDGTNVVPSITWDGTTYLFVNTAPTAGDVSASTRAGDPVEITLAGADAETAISYAVSTPDHGTVSAVVGGKVTYAPATGFAGTDSFTYTVTDGRGGSTTGDIDVTVAANRAPAVSNGTLSIKSGQTVPVTLSGTDPDGDAVTFAVTNVTGGTLTGGPGAARTFTPAAGFAGNAVIAYTVSDGRGAVTTGTLTVKIAKLASTIEIYRVSPTVITTRSTVKVYAAVTIDGKKAPAGTVVDVYAKGRKVTTAVVNYSGKVKATLPSSLRKGKATLKVSLTGTSNRAGSSDSVSVKVAKK